MEDWNTVVTVRKAGYKPAFKILGEFGPIERTGFFNVLVMRASNVPRMMEGLREETVEGYTTREVLARVIPVNFTFGFQTPREFEEKAKKIVLALAPELAEKAFHVRMHRRGFKGRLSTMEQERSLDDCILDFLREMGQAGRITFDDPDGVIAVETVGQQAGLSLWTRQELDRYPLLGLTSRLHTTLSAAGEEPLPLESAMESQHG